MAYLGDVLGSLFGTSSLMVISRPAPRHRYRGGIAAGIEHQEVAQRGKVPPSARRMGRRVNGGDNEATIEVQIPRTVSWCYPPNE